MKNEKATHMTAKNGIGNDGKGFIVDSDGHVQDVGGSGTSQHNTKRRKETNTGTVKMLHSPEGQSHQPVLLCGGKQSMSDRVGGKLASVGDCMSFLC